LAWLHLFHTPEPTISIHGGNGKDENLPITTLLPPEFKLKGDIPNFQFTQASQDALPILDHSSNLAKLFWKFGMSPFSPGLPFISGW
jgi:hypothetical protein